MTTLAIAGEVVTSLQEQEAIIERGYGTFVDVGQALMRIRDEHLYVSEFEHFKDYCKARWGISYSSAKTQIGASRVMDTLDGLDLVRLPDNAWQAQSLVKVLNQRGEQAVAEVWREVLARHEGDGAITAAEINKVVNPPASSHKPGWFELLGTAAEDLKAAGRHLDKLEADLTEGVQRRKGRGPNEKFREKAAEYAAWARELAERFATLAEAQESA